MSNFVKICHYYDEIDIIKEDEPVYINLDTVYKFYKYCYASKDITDEELSVDGVNRFSIIIEKDVDITEEDDGVDAIIFSKEEDRDKEFDRLVKAAMGVSNEG